MNNFKCKCLFLFELMLWTSVQFKMKKRVIEQSFKTGVFRSAQGMGLPIQTPNQTNNNDNED